MFEKIITKSFSIIQYLIFTIIAHKLQAELLKNFVDKTFVNFEKIACKFNFLATAYLKIYEELVKNEIKISNITEKDKVLVIGGGSVPATPILITKKTGAKVEAIDFDKKAIIESKKYIKTLKLENKINIIFAKGQSYPVKIFDVIFIVYGITLENEVLFYIAKNMKKSARIIYRTTIKPYDIKKDNKKDFSDLFDIKKVIRTKSLGQTDSVLLGKKSI